MQRREIKVGGVYEVRIGKALTEAAVNRIDGGVFFITDLSTHRKGEIRTAGRFIRFLRMNVEPPMDLGNLKPMEEHAPPKLESKDLEPQRNKLRKARRLLEEAHDLVGFKEVETRINDSIERVSKALQSLCGPNGKVPYVQVEIDLDDVEEQRTNVQAVHTLMKRVGNVQMSDRVKSLLAEVDRFLLGLIKKGKGDKVSGAQEEDSDAGESEGEVVDPGPSIREGLPDEEGSADGLEQG